MKSKIFITILTLAMIATSCGNQGAKKGDQEASKTQTKTEMDSTLAFNPADLPEEPIFNIYTTEGNIVIMLYKETPLHRDNFVKLASQKFYNNILFHRVIYNFMIQTGDPFTKDPSLADQYGEGEPNYTIPAEINPKFTHKKGAVAAARLGNTVNPKRESSGSQFYIVHNPDYCKHLNGEYTIFGETLDGFDVIDRIASMKTEHDRPVKDVRILSITPVL